MDGKGFVNKLFKRNKMSEEKIEKESTKKAKKKTSKKTKELTEQNEALELQIAEAKDKHLRLFAEFENFKKRNIKERIELRKTAAEETMHALLPIMDDFDRAKKMADSEDSVESFSEGVTLVYDKLFNTMKSLGLSPMESTGADFDAELHSAITEIPAPSDEMKGKIIDTIEKGYLLNDKIIRYAKVVVGK